MARAGISGIGLFSALGNNAAETVENLFSQSPRLPDVPHRIKTALSKPVFELPTQSDRRVPLTFLLSALEEALADAGLTKEDLKDRKVGIAIGTTVACQLDNIPFYEQLRSGTIPEDGQALLDYIEGIPAEFLRNYLGVNGPAITISNACASGADAALLGLNWLKTGVCDLVIAGGCDSVSKVAYNGFNALRVCSDHPCMPFDAGRSGLNLGDGAGVVILEDPSEAAKRGIKPGFELAGAGKTADAFHITQPEGSGVELENAIRTALNEAGITGIDFANAHGTGTLVNDRVESAVLKRIFGSDLHFHSTKAMTGHTLGAAGTIELALTTLMLKLQKTAPSLRCSTPSDEIAMLPDAEPVAIPGNAALSTSLAFGGSNTALVIKKIEAAEQLENKDIPKDKITISAFASLQAGDPTPQKMLEICRKYGLRRLDRITQLSLAAADAVADAVCGGKNVALITVTSYGPAVTTCKVLDDILDFPEEEILPTGFSHSVLNAAASYIGTCLKIRGPTFAIAGFEDPFREAVELGRDLLAGNRCSKVLIVAADEEGIISRAAEKLRTSSAPVFTEGAFALVLGTEENGAKLTLDDTIAGERLLSCGVPADFADQLKQGVGQITLRKLEKPLWKALF